MVRVDENIKGPRKKYVDLGRSYFMNVQVTNS